MSRPSEPSPRKKRAPLSRSLAPLQSSTACRNASREPCHQPFHGRPDDDLSRRQVASIPCWLWAPFLRHVARIGSLRSRAARAGPGHPGPATTGSSRRAASPASKLVVPPASPFTHDLGCPTPYGRCSPGLQPLQSFTFSAHGARSESSDPPGRPHGHRSREEPEPGWPEHPRITQSAPWVKRGRRRGSCDPPRRVRPTRPGTRGTGACRPRRRFPARFQAGPRRLSAANPTPLALSTHVRACSACRASPAHPAAGTRRSDLRSLAIRRKRSVFAF
jgi:hypothetical protein